MSYIKLFISECCQFVGKCKYFLSIVNTIYETIFKMKSSKLDNILIFSVVK